jgi:hypothetical protein
MLVALFLAAAPIGNVMLTAAAAELKPGVFQDHYHNLKLNSIIKKIINFV